MTGFFYLNFVKYFEFSKRFAKMYTSKKATETNRTEKRTIETRKWKWEWELKQQYNEQFCDFASNHGWVCLRTMMVFVGTVVDHSELWIYDRVNAKRQEKQTFERLMKNEQQAMQRTMRTKCIAARKEKEKNIKYITNKLEVWRGMVEATTHSLEFSASLHSHW